jgi:hypothetical protein
MDSSAGEFPRVLLINRNAEQNSLWAPLLWWWGYDVHVFERQVQGLRTLSQERFDLLVRHTAIRDKVYAYIKRVFTTFKIPTIAVVDELRRNVQCSHRSQTGLHALVRTPVTVHIDYLAATISDALGDRDIMRISQWLPAPSLIERSPSEMDERTEGIRFRLASPSVEITPELHQAQPLWSEVPPTNRLRPQGLLDGWFGLSFVLFPLDTFSALLGNVPQSAGFHSAVPFLEDFVDLIEFRGPEANLPRTVASDQVASAWKP